MTTGLIRTFVGSHPGPMEGLSKYFYWPDLQTPAGVFVDFGLFYDGSWEWQRGNTLYTSGRVMSVPISFRKALMHLLKIEF